MSLFETLFSRFRREKPEVELSPKRFEEAIKFYQEFTRRKPEVEFSPLTLKKSEGTGAKTREKLSIPKMVNCIHKMKGHIHHVNSVAISSDGNFGLSGSKDMTLRLWDFKTGRCLRIMEGHTDEVNSVAISPDGRYALSGSGSPIRLESLLNDNTLRNRKIEECLKKIGKQWVSDCETGLGYPVTINPDGKHCLSGSGSPILIPIEIASALIEKNNNTLRLWELSTGRCLRIMKGHTGLVYSVVISPDGKYCLSGSLDTTLRLWKIKTGICIRTIFSRGGTFYLFSDDYVKCVAISSDGRFGLAGRSRGTLKLYDLKTGKWIGTMEGHTKSVNSVAISPDARFALSGSSDTTLRLWEFKTGRCLRIMKGHTDEVNSVAISPNARFALSGSSDTTLRLWELSTGRCIITIEGHTKSVNSVAISPDGRFALSGSDDNTLRLWDIKTDRCLRTFEEHTNAVFSEVKEILMLGIKELEVRLKAQGIDMDIEEEAIEFLSSRVYDKERGAKEVKRVVKRELENPLAEMILKKQVEEGGGVLVKIKNDKITIINVAGKETG